VVCNRLKPNEEKTQIIRLGTRQQLDKVTVQMQKLSNATIPFSSVVNDLDVVLDRQLTMANHVAALSRSRLFHLRRLMVIKQSLTTVTDAGCNRDAGACFCQQSTGQLQQLIVTVSRRQQLPAGVFDPLTPAD